MLQRTLRGLSKAAMLIFLMSLVQVGMANVSKQTAPSSSGKQAKTMQDKIRHSLLMLPYYGVFDEIGYKIEGDTVTLIGEVKRPLLKDEAEQAVRKVDGVAKVVNNIEILPLSPMDDSLRLRTYRAIYSQPGFEKYGLQAVKPIRIIVNGGHAALEGVVDSEADKNLAGVRANGVPGIFSVVNNLQVVK